MTQKILSLLIILSLVGCSTRPQKVRPMVVPARQYQEMSCTQLNIERVKVEDKEEEFFAAQQKEVVADRFVVVGGILFFPLFLLLLGSDYEDELAEAKGQLIAIDKTLADKACPVVSNP